MAPTSCIIHSIKKKACYPAICPFLRYFPPNSDEKNAKMIIEIFSAERFEYALTNPEALARSQFERDQIAVSMIYQARIRKDEGKVTGAYGKFKRLIVEYYNKLVKTQARQEGRPEPEYAYPTEEEEAIIVEDLRAELDATMADVKNCKKKLSFYKDNLKSFCKNEEFEMPHVPKVDGESFVIPTNPMDSEPFYLNLRKEIENYNNEIESVLTMLKASEEYMARKQEEPEPPAETFDPVAFAAELRRMLEDPLGGTSQNIGESSGNDYLMDD